jgi:hypothetical protein
VFNGVRFEVSAPVVAAMMMMMMRIISALVLCVPVGRNCVSEKRSVSIFGAEMAMLESGGGGDNLLLSLHGGTNRVEHNQG